MSSNNNSVYNAIGQLSKETKNRLMNDIKKSLGLNSSDFVLPNSSNEPYVDSQLEKFLLGRLMEESFLIRMWLTILNFFQKDKSKEDIYKAYVIRNLENQINEMCKNPVIDFKRECLHVGFVEMFFNVYRYSMELKEFFKKLEKGGIIVEQTILEIIQSKVLNSKKNLEDFLDEGEYELFLKKEKTQNDLEESLKVKINEYISSIPSNTYKIVSDMFEFYYVFNSLAFFPYKSFFSFFNVDLLDNAENINIVDLEVGFGTSFSSVSKYLNSFFDILYTLKDIEINEDIVKTIISNYFSISDDISNSEIISREDHISRVEYVLKNVLSIVSKIVGLSRTLPYLNIFKVYCKNPVVSPKKYVPFFDVKNFYENILFLNVMGQAIKKHDSALKVLVIKEIKSLVRDPGIVLNLKGEIFNELNGQYSFKKLYFLNDFFKNIYDVRMMEVLRTINNVVLINNHDLRNIYVDIENNITALKKEIYNIYFEIDYKNEEFERYKRESKIDDTYKERVLKWCLNESASINKVSNRFVDYFIELKKRCLALLENHNVFIRKSLTVSYKSMVNENKTITLADVIGNLLEIINQALFIIKNL
ncbi:hypothetical protein QIA17_04085 [Borreliella californiensis]|uniref:Uncharacterized protein n=1 Tax=Borreliella californiensis TaxID=373543 RepID=A0A7W9ZKW8_9SPIR|nr:hypothetical protein [Borreliella californiensis]MBB6212818.1 hypothetical protein [Borreliella californiensis]WKC91962.1 hypothetical protein QIA17_04085 [Borreliella californiensis]WNY70714.1 hypothetical protein QIA39_03550 [Borreliella californiensis]